MKLSIIIPVYNVEAYLEKCLFSCLNQNISYDSYEIIVVNDGSSDNSLDIAQRIASQYPNIVIISQSNQGLSAARNKGFSIAKGEFVWFVDSDDWIEPNCLLSMLVAAEDVDVVALNHILVKADKRIASFLENAASGKILLQQSFYQQVPFYLYRRTFLLSHGLQFKDGVFHEDFEFTPRMLFFAEKLVVYNKPVYNYFQRENSISTKVRPKRAFDLLTVADSLYSFCNAIVPITYKNIYFNLISLAVNNALSIIVQVDSQIQSVWLSEMKSRSYLLSVLRNSSIAKYKIEGAVFSIIPITSIIRCYRIMQWINIRNK